MSKAFSVKVAIYFPATTVPRLFGAVAVLAVLCNFPLFPGFALCIVAASHPPLVALIYKSKNQAYCLNLKRASSLAGRPSRSKHMDFRRNLKVRIRYNILNFPALFSALAVEQ